MITKVWGKAVEDKERCHDTDYLTMIIWYGDMPLRYIVEELWPQGPITKEI